MLGFHAKTCGLASHCLIQRVGGLVGLEAWHAKNVSANQDF